VGASWVVGWRAGGCAARDARPNAAPEEDARGVLLQSRVGRSGRRQGQAPLRSGRRRRPLDPGQTALGTTRWSRLAPGVLALAADPYRYGTERCQNREPGRRPSFWQRIRTAMAL